MTGQRKMKSLSILVVDDDKDNAHSLGELFQMENHCVTIAHSGQEAIDAYAVRSFDLAFMDVMMPGKNGVESFLEIRRMQPQARIFMMTGYSVEELLRQAVRGGALGVLEKPFDAGEVLRLTHDVGRNGLVLAAPADRRPDLGKAIHEALSRNGIASRLMRDAGMLDGNVGPDDILVIDAQVSLIESVLYYKQAQITGHVAPTILVPPEQSFMATSPLRDVGVTGILNKPFDPLDLLNRLPQLAA
jgi:two-component system, NtrC family, response regulator HydG